MHASSWLFFVVVNKFYFAAFSKVDSGYRIHSICISGGNRVLVYVGFRQQDISIFWVNTFSFGSMGDLHSTLSCA